jgi:hypothetical protein
MKKIINEWKSFLKEDKAQDDIKVANTFVNALSAGTNEETQEEIRKQKKRILRIIDEFLASEKHFELSPEGDVARTMDGKQYYFPKKDFIRRLEVAQELISDGDYDLSRFSKPPTQLTDDPVVYDDYKHSGGPADTGFRIPEKAYEMEKPEDLNKHFQLWTNYSRGFEKKGSTPQEKLQASKDGLEAVKYFLHLYDKHTSKSRKGGPEYPLTPDDPYYYDLDILKSAIENQIEQFTKMVDKMPKPKPPPPKPDPDLQAQADQLEAEYKAKLKALVALQAKKFQTPEVKAEIAQAEKEMKVARNKFRGVKMAIRRAMRRR